MNSNETVIDRVNINDLKVDFDSNPRGPIDKETIDELIDSIRQDCILQPVLVRPEGDGYRLVAGYRRTYAAGKAGLTEIPALVRELDDERAEGAAFDENEQREEMAPMARARALAHQKRTLGTNAKVAERRSMTSRQVGALIKMCSLPESVQEIAMKHRGFGPDLAATLLTLCGAAGSEPVVTFLASQAMNGAEPERKIRRSVAESLTEISVWRDRNADNSKALETVPYVQELDSVKLTTAFADNPEAGEELAKRARVVADKLGYSCRTIRHHSRYDYEARANVDGPVTVVPNDDSRDRLRAASALVEIESDERGFEQVAGFCFDSALVRSEVEQTIKDAEAELEKIVAHQAAETKAAAAQKQTAAGEGVEVKSDRAIAKEEAEEARGINEDMGRRLLARSAKAMSKADTLETIKLVASIMVRQDKNLAAHGLRHAFASWKEVETKELKSGESREKVTLLTPAEAQERLLGAIERSGSVEEVARIMSDSMITGSYADSRELPQSKRVFPDWRSGAIAGSNRADMELIDSLAEGVLPEVLEEKRKASIETGYEMPETPNYGNFDEDDEDDEPDADEL